MLIHPSLSDVRSSYLWILCCSFWFGIRRSAHDAIQSIFVVAVTLWQPIDRPAVSNSRESPEQMFICQFSLTNPSSQFPSWFNTTRGMSTQLVVYLLAKLADAAVVGLPKDPPERRTSISSSVVLIRQATCLTSHTTAGCFNSRRQPIPASKANLFATKIPR